MQISTLGALIGLALAIILIIKKVAPVYSLIIGALVGGLIGGAGIDGTVTTMISGAAGIMSSVLRIISSGILAGVLIESGAAAKIANQIVKTLGEKRALFALALATMILCAVGVFVDVAVITVAPIALAIGIKLDYSKAVVLLAMIGGGKAGNIISPNPNTIALAENYNVNLSSLMAANIIPALFALAMTVILASYLSKRVKAIPDNEQKQALKEEKNDDLPTFWGAIIGPIVVIILLSLRPLIGVAIDPLIALPVGGIVGALCMGKGKELNHYMTYGLGKMMPVAVLLIGTGTIAGIIKASNLQVDMIALLSYLNMPAFLLAPISGILMAGATASTTAGATVASATFAPAVLAAGVSALSGAAMTHPGATVIDSLPHGSFFHATAGATNVGITERMKLIPYEAIIGLTSTIVSTIMWGMIL